LIARQYAEETMPAMLRTVFGFIARGVLSLRVWPPAFSNRMARFLHHDAVHNITFCAVKKSDIPPRPPTMRKGYWDSVIREVVRAPENKVVRLKFLQDYWAAGMESSARKAAARAGVKISAKSQDSTMYLWLASRGQEPHKGKCTTESPRV
jgi:hypothetical protein